MAENESVDLLFAALVALGLITEEEGLRAINRLEQVKVSDDFHGMIEQVLMALSPEE